ncbi:hypothetical protein ACN28S_01370 [Cystobacter fuscus]
MLLGAVLLLLLGMAWVSRRAGEPGAASAPSLAAPVSPTAGPTPAPGPSTAAPPALRARVPKEDILPLPGCWQGVAALDQSHSLEAFPGAIAAALGAADGELATYLQERLTELVGEDPARAMQVLGWARAGKMPEEVALYLGALKNAPAVHKPQVVEGLLQMGEDPGTPLGHRASALDALETQKRLSPANIHRLKTLALDVSTDSAGWVATRTLGRVMKEDHERTGTFAPYWRELLDVGEKSEELATRLLARRLPAGEGRVRALGAAGAPPSLSPLLLPSGTPTPAACLHTSSTRAPPGRTSFSAARPSPNAVWAPSSPPPPSRQRRGSPRPAPAPPLLEGAPARARMPLFGEEHARTGSTVLRVNVLLPSCGFGGGFGAWSGDGRARCPSLRGRWRWPAIAGANPWHPP